MGELEKDYKKTIELLDNNFKKDPVLATYIRASQQFDDWVKNGLAVKRGNKLRAPEDLHRAPYSFNSK